MSHASGRVRLWDGVEFWYEYNGTSDVVMPRLYETLDELQANWRRTDDDPECQHDPNCDWELAMISSNYGGGFHWPGQVCRKCKLIVSPLSWDDWTMFAADGTPKFEV